MVSFLLEKYELVTFRKFGNGWIVTHVWRLNVCRCVQVNNESLDAMFGHFRGPLLRIPRDVSRCVHIWYPIPNSQVPNKDVAIIAGFCSMVGNEKAQCCCEYCVRTTPSLLFRHSVSRAQISIIFVYHTPEIHVNCNRTFTALSSTSSVTVALALSCFAKPDRCFHRRRRFIMPYLVQLQCTVCRLAVRSYQLVLSDNSLFIYSCLFC